MQFNAHKYQTFSVEHIIKFPYCGLFLDLGLGKTVSTLTAIDILIYHMFEVDRVLIIAPKFVAHNTWPDEIAKWDHLKHLTYSIIKGNAGQRLEALKKKADIYIINRENVSWLVNQYGTKPPFDMLVIDELSSFKDPGSQRFRSLRMARPYIKRVVGLTGTPAPNGLQDLWSQLYLLDQGERLGKTVTGYREAYLSPDKMNGYHVQKWKVREAAKAEIYQRIGDICISMKKEDYLELPGRMEHDITIHLEPETQKKYEEFERDCIMQMPSTEEITALNAAALVNKLLQFSNGAVYDEKRKVHHLHDRKLEALEEIIEAAQGEPILLFYCYQHDGNRLIERFKARKFTGTKKDMDEWNAGKIPLLICHPLSGGHGLNLQFGGSIVVWFGLNWSLELYEQANGRLDRQGQVKPVQIYRLLCAGTWDFEVRDRIVEKGENQGELMNAVKARIDFVRKNS